MTDIDVAAAKLALRLRLMVLNLDAPFMEQTSICGETLRIEKIFDVELRHALCDHTAGNER